MRLDGFKIAMYHARCVDNLQRFADLMRIVDGVRFAHRMFSGARANCRRGKYSRAR